MTTQITAEAWAKLSPTEQLTIVNGFKAKAETKSFLKCKVSEKGALSLYGMGRFPVTLYKGQWERLYLDETKAMIIGFIKANPTLKNKGE